MGALHRSGLELILPALRAKIDLVGLEGPVPGNFGVYLQDVYPGGRASRAGSVGFARPLNVPSAAKADRYRQRLMTRWSPWIDGAGEMFVDASPCNLVNIEWLRAVFPGASFLIVTRDPRAVSAATAEWVHYSNDRLMQHWDRAYVRAWDAMGPDCTLLRYEDFCAAPARELARVMTVLDLPPSPAPAWIPERYSRSSDRNDRWLEAFGGRPYGEGSWSRFGYDLSGGGDPSRRGRDTKENVVEIRRRVAAG